MNKKDVKSDNNHFICLSILGPTASGKSKLAMQLANYLPCEIISVDSAMVYRKMNIGTAKPTTTDQKTVPHHLIDILDPNQIYSAAQFCNDALSKINDIFKRGNIPLLVGGTMLYFKVLQQGLSDLPNADMEIRKQLSERMDKYGLNKLHAELKQIDPKAAQRINSNDKQRIQRALEVYYLTGKPLTELQESKNNKLPYKTINLALAPKDRKLLHQKIEDRFNNMLEMGFADEVRALKKREDLHSNLPSMRTVGYRQIWQYLDGEFDYDEMRQRSIIATRQLAKRQLTWLRNWPQIYPFHNEKDQLLSDILIQLKQFDELKKLL